MGNVRQDSQQVQSAAAEARNTLRAKLRRVTESARERQCGVCAVRDAGPAIEAVGHPGAWDTRWIGVLTCGHIWTCPVCSAKLRAKRLERLVRAMGNAGGTWVLVTLTVRHVRAMALLRLIRGLMTAWRKTRQGGLIQRLWREKVSASARALEVTFSRNGWHPHLHVLLRCETWTEQERGALLDRWRLHVERELGPECLPDLEHAIRWSTPIDACRADELERVAYLTKLGAEVVGESKRGRKGSRSHWELASDAVNGDEQARAAWLEFYRATKGRRAIELDDRASRFAKKENPEASSDLADSSLERLTISVDSLELRALREYERRFDPRVLGVIMADVARAQKPREVVRLWLDLVTARVGGTMPAHAPSKTTERQPEAPSGFVSYYFDTS